MEEMEYEGSGLPREVYDEVEEEQGFAAAIGGAGSDATDYYEQPVAVEDTTTEPPQEEPVYEQPQEVQQTPSLTMEDVNRLLEQSRQSWQQEWQRERDKVFGKFGEYNQKLDEIKRQVLISPKARTNLEENFPELAEMLFEAGQQESPPPQPAYVAPPPPPMPNIQEIIVKEVEPVKLGVYHPDWRQVVNSQEFVNWKTSILPPDETVVLDSTWDSQYIAGKISEFKQWRQAASEKQARLAAAMVPKGIPRESAMTYADDDEESSMMQAYNNKYRH